MANRARRFVLLSAYSELVETVRSTEVMRRVLADLEKEPVALLYSICRQFEASREAVPDHHIHLSGYFGEVALQALLAAGLLQREAGRRLAIYQYRPTTKGVEAYKKLANEGWSPAVRGDRKG